MGRARVPPNLCISSYGRATLNGCSVGLYFQIDAHLTSFFEFRRIWLWNKVTRRFFAHFSYKNFADGTTIDQAQVILLNRSSDCDSLGELLQARYSVAYLSRKSFLHRRLLPGRLRKNKINRPSF